MNDAALRVVIAGGGTGGHVFPALAVAEELRARAPGSPEVLFVGSRGGLEERLVPAHGFPLELLEVGKLKGSGPAVRLRTLAGLPLALASALRLVRRFSPHVVVGVGGFASGPVVLAAAALGLPILLLEQNSVPGITNRALARLARRTVIAFSHAADRLPAGRTVLLGNPLRPSLLAALQAAPPLRQRLQQGASPILLVLGGSQGASAINELMAGAAPGLFAGVPGLRLLHQTGPGDLERVAARYREAGLSGAATAVAFIDDMADAMTSAWLVLGRSGATTLAELAVAGLPAVLIPYPFAADDHQAHNASDMVRAGGALMLRQEALTPALLQELLRSLLTDPARLAGMGAAMRSCAHPDAGERVVELVLQLAGR